MGPRDPGLIITQAGHHLPSHAEAFCVHSVSVPQTFLSALFFPFTAHKLTRVHDEADCMLISGVAETGSTDTHLLWPLSGILLHTLAHVLQITGNDMYCCF